ncbi:MAG: RNA polymerase sigma factor, partial [Fimbriimonadaceae bacterium]
MKSQLWENHLVERAQNGEAVAFDLLIDMHRSALRAQAMRFLRNAEDADDAVQEAIIKTYKGLKGFQKGRPVL